MKFSIGDLIVYGENGVCRVEDQVERVFLDETQQCYKLMPIYQSCVIFTPVENSNVFMRPVITKEEASFLLENHSTFTPESYEAPSPRALSQVYDKVIKNHDCREMMTFIVSIYEKRRLAIESKKKLSAVDERYLKRAEELLFGELAAVLNIEKFQLREKMMEKYNI
jgi:CarD family transcriptional regulator